MVELERSKTLDLPLFNTLSRYFPENKVVRRSYCHLHCLYLSAYIPRLHVPGDPPVPGLRPNSFRSKGFKGLWSAKFTLIFCFILPQFTGINYNVLSHNAVHAPHTPHIAFSWSSLWLAPATIPWLLNRNSAPFLPEHPKTECDVPRCTEYCVLLVQALEAFILSSFLVSLALPKPHWLILLSFCLRH